ncbi:MAG TPA: aminoglycoside 6-adenylyltransferase, partial [Chloroflexota bacterium]|nr:aminoglycoside 6-adenylyltransferase [Chloroflexota bacterium]
MSSYEETVIQRLAQFGERNDAIRAVLLTSSLCDPDAPVDVLSDFDVEFFFEDPTPFVESDDWIQTLGMGSILALWHWPNEWDHEPGNGRSWMRMVYFEDGTRVDISLCYMADLRALAGLDRLPDHYDIGYEVLLDKDGVTGSIKPASHRAFILRPPSEEQFASRAETFWMESIHVAKFLWRDEIVAAKWMLDGLRGRNLCEVLEWSVAIRHCWDWRPGKLGRGLPKVLDPDTRRELIESYAAGDIEDMWQSLLRTTALYRKTASEVAGALGFEYPCDLD